MITIEIGAKEIREVLADHVNRKLGSMALAPEDIELLVKSKQNYKAEWEVAGVVYTNARETYIPELKVKAVER